MYNRKKEVWLLNGVNKMIFSEKEYTLKTKFVLPMRVVASENCENAEQLLLEAPRQAYLGDAKISVIKLDGWVVLDFGKELQGGVDITIKEAPQNAKLRIVFGESVSEAMSEIGIKNATNDHAARDIVVPVTSWQHFRMGNTGFRFVKLQTVNCCIHMTGIQAAWEYYNAPYRGSFESSDKMLNEIWKTGAYTVHLNMQEYVWDGIKRDRLVWIGDMHPEASTISKVFGGVEVVSKSLDLIRDVTPVGKWMNGIPAYSLWWIIIHRDWYMYTGNREYLNCQKEYLLSIIPQIMDRINPDGTDSFDDRFIDWNSRNTENESAGFRSVLIIGLEAAAELCDIFGCDTEAKLCCNAAGLLKKQKSPYKNNKQVAALTALAGINDVNEISNDILIQNGGEGLSAFLGYYTLICLAKSGNMKEALDIVKEYWGAMLKLGATTFWEEFDLDWTKNAARIDEIVPEGMNDIHGDFGKFCYKQFRHSLCHGWASGPTAFLSEYVLGVKICEPGCRKIKIEPQLGDLDWVKGSYPTPYGCIEIEHIRQGSKIKTMAKLPKDVELLK